jgi:D-glycero-alpha-D-manno-heptose-7-phosphate kinase
MIIRSKAPLRIGLAGGGTDIPPYPERYGGLVLNATINLYAVASIIPNRTEKYSVSSLDYSQTVNLKNAQKYEFDGTLDLAKGIIRRLKFNNLGFELFTRCDALPGTGLGSSSAMTVAMIGAFKEWQRLPLSKYEIAMLAYQIERQDIGLAGGYQDQFAATFGGFNLLELNANEVIVIPLNVDPAVVCELQENTILYLAGNSRVTQDIERNKGKSIQNNDPSVLKPLHSLKDQVQLMKKALFLGKANDIGELLGCAWEEKKRLGQQITTPEVEEAYALAMKSGAIGGKLCGAGGGGVLLLYCQPTQKGNVLAHLAKLGGTVLPIEFTMKGMETWRA